MALAVANYKRKFMKMGKQILIIVLLVIIMINKCYSQNDNKMEMEKFNIEKYKGLAQDTAYSPSATDLYLVDNDQRIRILYFNDMIQVEETNIDSAFKRVKVYSRKSNNLLATGSFFYNFPIGNHIGFDENGNVINNKDYDTDYQFSLTDLEKKMKEEYKIDIMNVERTFGVNRYIETTKIKLPLYEIYYRDAINRSLLHCFILNGNNGETLYTITRFVKGEKGSLLEEYINSLK